MMDNGGLVRLGNLYQEIGDQALLSALTKDHALDRERPGPARRTRLGAERLKGSTGALDTSTWWARFRRRTCIANSTGPRASGDAQPSDALSPEAAMCQ